MKTDETKVLSPVEQPAPKPRKQRGLWWVVKWSLAVIVPMIVLIVLLNFRMGPGKGRPLVRISRQTTYATSPLKPSGDVDYVAYLNQQNAITPENNAFVELLKILGPVTAGQMPPPKFFQLLGIDPMPQGGNYLIKFPYVKKLVGRSILLADGTTPDSEQAYEITQTIPFEPGVFLEADQWFETNEQHLNAIHSAVQKPGFFIPCMGKLMVGVDFSLANGMREIARALQRSSMARLGQGDVAGTIDDQVAMLQLARHVGRQGTMVEHLIALAIEGMAHRSISQTIFSDKCTAEDLARLAAELKAQSRVLPVGPLHLQSERVAVLDAVIHIGRNGPIPWNGNFSNTALGINSQPPTVGDELLRASIDWETVCVTLNEIFDKLEKALASDGASRATAIEQFEAELKAIEQEFGTPKKKILSALAGRGSRSTMAGNILATTITPGVRQLSDADRRSAAQHSLNEVAVALQRFRLEHGKYPMQLDELVPVFLAEVPLDPFTGGPLVYKPDKGDPFLLYSRGPNKKDDGGVDMFEAQNNQYDLIAAPIIRTVQQWIEANVAKRE